MISREAVLAYLKLVDSMLELIRAKGSEGMPSGHLYAHVMGVMTLDQYEQIVSSMIAANRVTRSNYLLTYVEKV